MSITLADYQVRAALDALESEQVALVEELDPLFLFLLKSDWNLKRLKQVSNF